MIKMSLAQAAKTLGLENIPAADKVFQGVSIDTRTLVPGNLFIAIKGDRVDGHDFVEEALKKVRQRP